MADEGEDAGRGRALREEDAAQPEPRGGAEDRPTPLPPPLPPGSLLRRLAKNHTDHAILQGTALAGASRLRSV